MSFTAATTLDGDDWVVVYDGSDGGMVQLSSDGPVKVHIGQSKPMFDDPGIVLWSDGLTEIAWDSLPDEGDKVYVSAPNRTETVVVLAGGSPPSEEE